MSSGEEKSKGIKLQIEYPLSWASIEAERPNIVRKFVSERGRGSEYALILVKSVPPEENPSKREIGEAFTRGIREFVPPGGRFIAGNRISFDGLPGATVTFGLGSNRMGQDIKLRTLMYMTFYKDRFIMVQFTTKEEDAIFAKFEPLFRLMANSIIVLNQYE